MSRAEEIAKKYGLSTAAEPAQPKSRAEEIAAKYGIPQSGDSVSDVEKALALPGKLGQYAGGLARTAVSMSPLAAIASAIAKKPVYKSGDLGNALLGNAPTTKDYRERLGINDLGTVYEGGWETDANGNPKYNARLKPVPVTQWTDELGDIASEAVGTGLAESGIRAVPWGKIANSQILKHIRPTPSVARVTGKEKLDQIAEELKNRGLVKLGANADDTLSRVQGELEQLGKIKGGIVSESKTKLNPVQVAKRFDDEVISPLRGNSELLDEVKLLERKRDDFLRTYAPGYSQGGRAPGSPTVITRKSVFKENDPMIAEKFTGLEQSAPIGNIKQIGTKQGKLIGFEKTEVPNRTYRTDFLPNGDKVERTIVGNPSSVTNPVFEENPVNAYLMGKGKTPQKLAKEIVEKRMEGVPTYEMTPTQIESLKTAAQNDINYLSNTGNTIGAKKAAANFYKRIGEEAIPDPNFVPVKKSLENLYAAEGMLDRTASLTNGGLVHSLGDMGVSGLALKGLMEGNAAGVPLVAARGLTKGRVASSLGVTANALDKYLPSGLQAGTAQIPYSTWLQMINRKENQ